MPVSRRTRASIPWLIAGLVFARAAAALAAPPSPATREPAPPSNDEASYAVGLTFAAQWREAGLVPGLSDVALVRGIRDGLGGKAPSAADRSRAGAFLKAAYGALGDRNKAEAQAFLARNAKAKGVQTTASGLQYLVLAPGDAAGPTPGPNDHVTVDYRGTLLDGTEFDSSYAHGKPAVVRPATLIAGMREALAMMTRGARWRVFAPPELAYGTSPPPSIPTNSLLVFDLEVKGIEPAAGAPAASLR